MLRLPALLSVVPIFHVAVEQLDAGHPLHAPFAVVARDQHAGRVAVAVGERLAVHLVGDERRILHRLLVGDIVRVAVGGLEYYVNDAGLRTCFLDQGPQRDTRPDGVAYAVAANRVANAH